MSNDGITTAVGESVVHEGGPGVPVPSIDELEVDPLPSVHEVIAWVMRDLPGIPKGDRYSDSSGTYTYRGIEALTREVQPLLARHGLVIVPNARIVGTVPAPAMKEGWQDVLMEVEWTIIGPDGSRLTATTNGIGRDRMDKGANKAQTQAYKYLLLHLFCVADAKDDADASDYEHGVADEEDLVLADEEDRQALRERIDALPEDLKEGEGGLRMKMKEAMFPNIDRLTERQLKRASAMLRGFEARARRRTPESGAGDGTATEPPQDSQVAPGPPQSEPEQSGETAEMERPEGTEATLPDIEWPEWWPDDENQQRQRAASVLADMRDLAQATPQQVHAVAEEVKTMRWQDVDRHLRAFGFDGRTADGKRLHVDTRRMLLTGILVTQRADR